MMHRSRTPSPTRDIRVVSTQEAYLPDRVSDSLALSSYLKLRQEHRSPQAQFVHGRELFEEFRFDENVSLEADHIADDESERSLSFTEKLDDINELDFKAMRLLVHTSVHEKEIAQSKVSGLDNEITMLRGLAARYRNSASWKLPMAIVKVGLGKVARRFANCFHVWKEKTLSYRIAKLQNAQNKYVFKLARRNILKVRLVYMGRAFQKWHLQNKHTSLAIENYGTTVVQRHKYHSVRATFKCMRQYRRVRVSLRHMNRILRAGLFRKCLAQWRRMTCGFYRTKLVQQQQSSSLADLTRAMVTARAQVKKAFALWATGALAQRSRQMLTSLTRRCLDNLLRKYTSKVLHAFVLWRRVTTALYTNLQSSLKVWKSVTMKSVTFFKRRALLKWKAKCQKFNKVVKCIAYYLTRRAQHSLREAFNRLIAAQQAYLRQLVKRGVDRWFRRFLISVDVAKELTCRSILSARFRHWHHTTHTVRHTTQFRGQLDDVHARLVRTKSDLQEQTQRKRELEQEHSRKELTFRMSLIQSKYRGVDKILRRALHKQAARGFQTWLLYTRRHHHREQLEALELAERTKRVQGTMLRWFQQTSHTNLFAAWQIWHLTVRQLGGTDAMVLRRRAGVCQRVFQEWKTFCRERHVERKCIKRMSRQKQNAQLHLAWDTWVRKVTFLRNKCKAFVKLLQNKRRSSCRLAMRTWKHVLGMEDLHTEKRSRARLEETERILTLQLHWSHFQLGIDLFRRDKRHMLHVVINKITARLRSGFDRWFHASQRLSKLRSVCMRLVRHYAHALGKFHFLAFARWKAAVWDYQKICFQDVQSRLADAHERILSITEQQLVLENDTHHLKTHNERADRIARTLYHQVHRMLSSRRLFGMVKLVFDSWKANHELIQRCKQKLRQFFIRCRASTNTLEMAGALRTWVVAVHIMQREEQEQRLAERHDRRLTLHRYFDQWQTYRTVRRMQMMSVIIRLRTGIQSGVQKTIAAAFALWRSEVEAYLDMRHRTLTSCFQKWNQEVAEIKKKKAVIYRLFPKLNAANIMLYFKKWKENTRILRLLCDTIVRMMEVSHLNQTHVSTVRLRTCWSRWTHIVSVNNNQTKACRMIVQCYRKILRTAMYAWRRQSDHMRNKQQVRRMTMAKLLQMARLHGWNRFYVWKGATDKMRAAEEHVDKMGVVLKRLRVIRRKRRAWGAWKKIFAELNSPVLSTGATLRVCGPKYVNAITRAQYWSSTLMRSVLVNTTLEPVLNLALEALHSTLPEYTPSLYYLHHEHEYLWGHSLSAHSAGFSSAASPGRSSSPSMLDRTNTALKQLHLSRRFSPVPHDQSNHGITGQYPQYFPATLSPTRDSHYQETPFRVPSQMRMSADSEHRAHSPAHPFQHSPYESSRMSPTASRFHGAAGSTVLLGEGAVGRCAQQRCVQVFRQGRVLDGMHSQSRLYSSMTIPVPEFSFNINVNAAASDCKDKVATAVLPIVWGGNVVAVVQFSAPNVDPLGVFYDAHESAHTETGASVDQRNKAIKHMSATIRDLLDFSEINADQTFAATVSHDAAAQQQQQQTVLGRTRTLRAQMMYQLLQLCIELKLDEERSVGLMSLVSTLAEVFGRHFPPHLPVFSAAEESTIAQTPVQASYLSNPLSSMPRSPRREDVTIPAHVNLNGSHVGLALFFNRTTEELKQADTVQSSLLQETQNLGVIIERLKKSRSKYLERSEQLQQDLSASQESLEAERAMTKKLSHAVKKAEARLKSFEQQQAEIGRLNNIMRSAASVALNR